MATNNTSTSVGQMANKKVTIQMKDMQGNLKPSTGTFVINKNTGNISGNLYTFLPFTNRHLLK